MRTVTNSNRTFVERGRIDIPRTHIHNRSFSRICTGTSIIGGRVKQVIWGQTSLLAKWCGYPSAMLHMSYVFVLILFNFILKEKWNYLLVN